MVKDNYRCDKKKNKSTRRSMLGRIAGTTVILGSGISSMMGSAAAAEEYQSPIATREGIYHYGARVGEICAVPAGITNLSSNNLSIGWSYNCQVNTNYDRQYGWRNERLEVTPKKVPTNVSIYFENIDVWEKGNGTEGGAIIYDSLAAVGSALGIPGAGLIGLIGPVETSDISYPNDRSYYEIDFENTGTLGPRSGGTRCRVFSDGNGNDINGEYEIEYKFTADFGEEVVRTSPNRVVFEKIESVTQTSSAEFEIDV